MTIKLRKTGIVFNDPKDLFRVLTTFHSNVEQAIKQISDEPFISGNLIEVERSNTNQFDINTGFRRSAKGWIVVDTNVAVSFYRVKTDRDSSGILSLVPSAAGTYSFWVF